MVSGADRQPIPYTGGEKLITILHNLYSVAIMISEETDPEITMYHFPSDPTRWIAPQRPAASAFRATAVDGRVPDLHSQFEALLDAVWDAEENWRFDDRLDQALNLRR